MSEFCIADPNTEFANLYPNGLSLVDLIPFYEAVEAGQGPKLEWVCPGRVKPQTEEEKLNQAATSSDPNNTDDASKADPVDAAKLAEFDFDEPSSGGLDPMNQSASHSASFTTDPGSASSRIGSTPYRRNIQPRQPRVASMDKILLDMRKSRISSSPSSAATQQARVTMPGSDQQPTTVVIVNELMSSVPGQVLTATADVNSGDIDDSTTMNESGLELPSDAALGVGQSCQDSYEGLVDGMDCSEEGEALEPDASSALIDDVNSLQQPMVTTDSDQHTDSQINLLLQSDNCNTEPPIGE